ncbi:MAG: STAS domain-containing protein [Armatimonadota bacterium]
MELRIERWDHAGRLVELRLEGRLDRLGSAYLAARLRDALRGPLPAAVAVNLDQVACLDAVGMEGLLQAARIAAEGGCRLVLVIQDTRVRGLLEGVGLTKLLVVLPDLQGVLAGCCPTAATAA